MVASVEVYTAEISWEPVVVSTRTRMRQTLPKEAMKLGVQWAKFWEKSEI